MIPTRRREAMGRVAAAPCGGGSPSPRAVEAAHRRARLLHRGPRGSPSVPRPGEHVGRRRLRALFGDVPAEPLRVRETGSISGSTSTPDRRAARSRPARATPRIAAQELGGKRVLTCSRTPVGSAWPPSAPARAVCNVDSSQAALDLASRHRTERQQFVVADVFEWLPAQAREPADLFDLVIADPPPMTSRMTQIERVLSAYRRLYRAAAALVAPGGRVAACCCTSRVNERAFVGAVTAGLGPGFRLERRLPPEVDHPVGFPEADYLKILLFTRAPAAQPDTAVSDGRSGAAAT